MLVYRKFLSVILLFLISTILFTGCEKLAKELATEIAWKDVQQSLPKSTLAKSLSGNPDIIVNTTSDVTDFGGSQQVSDLPGPDGFVTLREAMIAAENTSGSQVIHFNITTNDNGFNGIVFTIKPLSPLPELKDNGTTIDGSTQMLSTGDSNPEGPEIVIDGSLSGETAGFNIRSDNNTIRGLVIHSFKNTGVQFNEDPTYTHPMNVQIAGCYIGTDESGSLVIGNGWEGIAEAGSNNLIGGPEPEDGNLISGNNTEINIGEIQIDGSGTMVQRNVIGTNCTGTVAFGKGFGIIIGRNFGSKNVIVKENLITGNARAGIIIQGINSNGNTLSRNKIFSNGGLAIDLNSDGVTQNDIKDVDIGPNFLMNFPILISAKASKGKLIVEGIIDTPNPKTVTLEFFANPVPTPGGDPSGYGEGAIYLGSCQPNQHGKVNAALPPVAPGTLIAATATDANGNTSEFSAYIEAR
jgi:parallel beta-helix repeat protein